MFVTCDNEREICVCEISGCFCFNPTCYRVFPSDPGFDTGVGGSHFCVGFWLRNKNGYSQAVTVFMFVVPRDRIELPTRGFSVPGLRCPIASLLCYSFLYYQYVM